jgi:hypothetical protein
LDSDKFERCALALAFQAQFDDLSDPLHEGVKILGLGMTTFQGWDGGDVIAFLVAFNEDGEFASVFHRAILAWGQRWIAHAH